MRVGRNVDTAGAFDEFAWRNRPKLPTLPTSAHRTNRHFPEKVKHNVTPSLCSWAEAEWYAAWAQIDAQIDAASSRNAGLGLLPSVDCLDIHLGRLRLSKSWIDGPEKLDF